MNSKFREIGLAVSGMMCAVMLFTCALPAKAAVVCPHTSRFYLGKVKFVEEDHYTDQIHYYIEETQACCEQCGMIIVLQSELKTEDHYMKTEIDWQLNTARDYCTECNYSHSYDVIVIQ